MLHTKNPFRIPGKKGWTNLDMQVVVLAPPTGDESDPLFIPGRFMTEATFWRFIEDIFHARTKTDSIEIKGVQMPGKLIYPTFNELKKELDFYDNPDC